MRYATRSAQAGYSTTRGAVPPWSPGPRTRSFEIGSRGIRSRAQFARFCTGQRPIDAVDGRADGIDTLRRLAEQHPRAGRVQRARRVDDGPVGTPQTPALRIFCADVGSRPQQASGMEVPAIHSVMTPAPRAVDSLEDALIAGALSITTVDLCQALGHLIAEIRQGADAG